MKVLLIGPIPPPTDGCSYANKVLQRNLDLKNIRNEIINTNTSIVDQEQGNAFSIRKSVSFIKNYFSLYKVFYNDVIYFTPGQTFYGVVKYAPFILSCILLRKPYVIHLHGNYLGRQYKKLSGLKKWLFQFLLSKASAAIVITKSLTKNFDELLPINKIAVAFNFVEQEYYNRTIIKKADKLRILYLSNLMPDKGIIEVLDALIELTKKEIDFEATIAGHMEDSVKSKFYKRLELLKSKVNYLGAVTGERKIKCLIEANTFILPTYYKMEGLPISLLEGLATGNIIITTEHAGIPDVINANHGFIIPTRSSTAITECLIRINENISGYLNQFSQSNIAYSKQNFTEENYTNKIVEVLYGISSIK